MHGISGRPLWDASGEGIWVGTGAENSIVHIALMRPPETNIDRILHLPGKQFWASGIARDSVTGRMAISGMSYGSVALTDAAASRIEHVISVGDHPMEPTWSRDGRQLYVALWGERSIAVIDSARAQLTRKIPVGLHPEAVVLTRDGWHLYVANTDDDTVSEVDTREDRVVGTYRISALWPQSCGALA